MSSTSEIKPFVGLMWPTIFRDETHHKLRDPWATVLVREFLGVWVQQGPFGSDPIKCMFAVFLFCNFCNWLIAENPFVSESLLDKSSMVKL